MNKRELILGLDVSTSVVGVCVLDKNDSDRTHHLEVDAIVLTKYKTMWDKADFVEKYLEDLRRKYSNDNFEIFVEEALLGFRPGLSSATTIASLLRFNGITSYISKCKFGVHPQFVSAAKARKICGMKMQKISVAKMSQKEQVFQYMSQNDLNSVQWPLKKSGKIVDWSRDATDAYVIARASQLMNM